MIFHCGRFRKKDTTTRGTGAKQCIPDFDAINTVHLTDTSTQGTKQLGCSCTYTSVYGLPCIHSLVVGNTMKPKWPYVTHDDVSVRWLKSYYLYSLPVKIIPQEDIQEKTKQVFQSLRRHEVVGIHINLNGILIHQLKENHYQPNLMNWNILSNVQTIQTPTKLMTLIHLLQT